MIAARHLGLAQRKVLAPRLCLIESLLPREALIHAAERGFYLTDLEESVHSKAALQWVLGVSEDQQPLDEFVHALVDDRTQETRAHLRLPDLALINPLLDDFSKQARRITCNTCGGGKICRGRSQDDQLVSDAGYCIAHLKELFQIASVAATAYYEHFLPNVSVPRFVFSTEGHSETPHDIQRRADVAVGGTAERHHGEDGIEAEVTLQIKVDDFNKSSYLTTLYVLLHECVVHAFEGLAEPAPSWDGFAEGWMDRVAVLILQEIVSGTGPAAHLGHKLRAPDQHGQFGETFAADRANYHDRSAASWIAIGRAAAGNLFRLLRVLPEGREAIQDMFLRLSFDVNVQQVTPEVRSDFIRALAYPSSVGDKVTGSHVIANLVRGYLRGTIDASSLVLQVGRLAS